MLAPFLEKASLMKSGRQQIYHTNEKWNADKRSVVHFHAASLGEFEQARPVIEQFRTEFNFKILLTFFSPSGYEVRKHYEGAEHVCYLPFDTPKAVTQFVQFFNPTLSLFVKYEFWYNISLALKNNGTTLVSFSTIFRADQGLFKKPNSIRAKTIGLFDFFFVQNKLSEKLLQQLGIRNVTIAGDTRFDRVVALCQHPRSLPAIENFVNNLPCFVVGSSWKEDLAIIMPALATFNNPLKIIIAPHNISEKDLKEVEKITTGKTIRYSKINDYTDENILIIDNIGMLSSVYKMATICHIGGGFKTGLHNTLEAVTFGKPIIIGPQYEKFDEVKGLINIEACFSVASSDKFRAIFLKLYNNTPLREEIANKLEGYIRDQSGATEKIISYCRKELS